MRQTIFSLLFLFAATVLAGDNGAQNAEDFTLNAVAVNKVSPKYPTEAQRSGLEGWVVLSYVVSVEGEVLEPVVVDSTGQPLFERAAQRAIEQWRYEPALSNGKPVEQCYSLAKFSFVLEGEEVGAGADFTRSVKKIEELIAEGELETAKGKLDILADKARRNLYEDAWYWYIAAEYFKAAADTEQQLSSLRRAAAYEGVYLPLPYYAHVLKNLYIQEVTAGNFPAALQVADMAAPYAEQVPEIVKFVEHAASLRAKISQIEAIEISGTIGKHGHWSSNLMREQFSVQAVEGLINHFELRCDYGWHRFEPSELTRWSSSDDSGNCCLFVFGEVGTTVKLTEYLSGLQSEKVGGNL